jgi:hypothetical protein
MDNILPPLKETERPSEARVFLEFKYPEIKDLLKHFLTLIAATLVFSVTFSEKIVDFQHARRSQHVLVIGAWFLLISALGSCGIGLYTLYLAAEHAIATEVFKRVTNFHLLARRSYFYQDMAGVLFGLGLCLLVASAAINFLQK